MIRIVTRGFVGGVKQFEEGPLDADATDLEELARSHALRLLALPGGEKHMIEVEFLDEPDENQRFFRFGTDPGDMVIPMEINWKPKTITTWPELIQFYRTAVTAPRVPFHEQPEDTPRFVSILQHCSWMLDNMPDAEKDALKFQRWLGFAQAFMLIAGIYTLGQLREQTRVVAQNQTQR